jgi:hypothetical protein
MRGEGRGRRTPQERNRTNFRSSAVGRSSETKMTALLTAPQLLLPEGGREQRDQRTRTEEERMNETFLGS